MNNDDVRSPSASNRVVAGVPLEPADDVVVDALASLSGRSPAAPRAPVLEGPAVAVAPPLPFVPAASASAASATSALAGPDLATSTPTTPREVLLARAEALVSEANAATAANAPGAAALWIAAGRMNEHDLASPRDAAACYQEAFRADPGHLPALQAARGLFFRRGLWRMVALLLDEEMRLPGAALTPLRLEKARVLEGRLGRADEALALYRSILVHEPAHPVAVDAVVRALTRQRRHDLVVDTLVAAASAAPRAPLSAAWLVQAGLLCETKLGDEARALALLEQAEAALPDRRAVVEALRRLYARRGDSQRLAAVLEQLARSASTDAEAVALASERARVLLAIGDEAAAVAALEAARARARCDVGILDELCRLYDRLRLDAQLADALEVRADAAQDIRSRAMLIGDAARVAEERLGDDERAIRLYRLAAELDGDSAEVLASLGRLFARTQRFDDLSVVYDQQIERLSDPQQMLPLLFKHAELLATVLDDPDGALRRLHRILAATPGYVPAARMAAQLCTRLGRWNDLVSLWEAQLADERAVIDRASQLYLLQRIANVQEDRLVDLAAAASTYERMLRIEAGHLPALRKLASLYTSLERWDDVIRVLGQEAECVEDQNVVVSLWFRVGQVLADQLGRIDDAVDAFFRALTFLPTYLPALKALGSIYARTGRWAELIAMHRQEADAVRDRDQRAHLLYQAAQLTLEKLGDVDAAVSAFHDVLAESPSHQASLHALEGIARRRNDHPAMLAAHERALAVADDVRSRAQLRCRIAEHLESALGRTDEAIGTLEAALVEDPALLTAHEQLITLLSRHGRAAAERTARERVHDCLPDDEARIANLRSLLTLSLHHLDDADQACAAAHRLLELAPDDRAALRALLTCALRRDDVPRAIEAATQLAAVEPAADEVCNLHLQLATWREFHLTPPADPLPDWLRILQFQPQNPLAVAAVERLYVERGAWEALSALLETQAPSLTEPSLVVDNAMKRGAIAEERLGRFDVARACYERVLGVAREHLPAIARLRELYGREGRPQDQLRLTTLEAETSNEPARAILTLLEAGRLQRDQFNDVDAAADCFGRVLDRDPSHAEAYAALEALLTNNGRFGALARFYERAADALASDAASLDRRVDLLMRAAQLHHERLGSVDEAARLFERLLALAPDNAAARYGWATLTAARGDHGAAIAAFEQLLEQCTDDAVRARLHVHLGTIFAHQQVAPDRAVQHLSAALSMQPAARAPRALLAHAHELAGASSLALQAHLQLLPGAHDDDERRELHASIARLAEATGETTLAAFHLDALTSLVHEPAVARSLADRAAALFERVGDFAALAQTTVRQADAVAGTDAGRAAELLLRAARVQVERLKNTDAALKTARRALELAPDVVEVRALLADLYGLLPNQQLLAIEEHRRVVRAGRLRIESLRGLYKGWMQQRAPDRAFCAAEAMSLLSAADDGEERFFTDAKRQVRKETSEQLQPDQVTSWLAHPAQRNAVRDVLSACAFDLGRVFAVDVADPPDKRFVLKHRVDDPLRTLTDGLAHNLGLAGGSFDVWRSQNRRSGVDVFAGVPVVVVVGLDVTRTHPTREQRFLLGRRLMALHSGHHLLRGMTAVDLATLLTAIGRSQDKAFPMLGSVEQSDVEALARKVGGALSRKARGALEQPLEQLVLTGRSIDLDGYLRAASLSENRAGLLLCGALDAAVRLVARDHSVSLSGSATSLLQSVEGQPQLVDLFAYGLSDEFFQARQALKVAVDV